MKKLTCTLALTLGALALAHAEDAADKKASAPNTSVLETKNKSSFVLEESGRNPFWPIGWKPAAKNKATTTEQVGPEIPASAFIVTSITLDPGARFAIINGKVMNEGTVFGLQMGSQTYQITLKAIQDGQVVLLRRDQEIVVPLRRR